MTGSQHQQWQYEFEAIGTKWVIDIGTQTTKISQEDLLRNIHNRISKFDKTYSRFRTDSLVSQISRTAGIYNFPADAKLLFSAYRKFYELSGGAVTPLIGKTMEEAGYDASYSLKPKLLTSLPEWDEVLYFENNHLTVKQPVMLDFGAAGKGYLVDIIGELIESYEINNFCIDAGGDILQKSITNDPIKIGLENPKQQDEVIGIAEITNKSLCGSAGNRRKWEGYNHIINPVNLKSPENIIAVWTVANCALFADGLATCLFFTEPAQLKSHFDFEYLIIYKDMTFEHSANFPAKIYLN